MILRAAQAHQPRLSDGSPLVIVSEGVADPSPIASPALPVWIASARGGGMLLHPLGTRAPDPAETVPLAAPPPGAVAMVAPEAHALSALARWWEGAAARPAPYVVLATSGAGALGGLLAAVAEALSASLLREAAAARALPAPDPRASAAGESVPVPEGTAALDASSIGPDSRLAWAAAQAIEGGVDLVALGDEAPRPLLRAPARGRAILLLPGIAALGAARLRVSLRHGSGRGAAVSTWLLPEGEAPGDLTDLAAPGSAWTGWRALEEEGALSLPLPAGFGARGYLALGLRAGDEEAVVEVEAAALEAGPPLAPDTSPAMPAIAEAAHPAVPPARQPGAGPGDEEMGPAAPDAGSAIPPPRAPLPDPPALASAVEMSAGDAPVASAAEGRAAPAAPLAGTSHEGVRLKGHEAGGVHRHLDLEVAGLAAGAERWPLVRLKFAPAEGEPLLEFRLTGGWPPVFEEWLGRQSDRHGPFLRILRSEVADFLELVTDPRDAALIRALLLILPGLAEEGCRQAGIGAGEAPDWVEAARALQAGARPA